jgi:signal transduction histidine kinase
MTPLTALSLVVALAAAAIWSGRPAVVATAAGSAVVASLVDTVGSGPPDARMPYWLLLELLATLLVTARTIRRLPTREVAILGGALVAVVGVAPLRIARWLDPPAPTAETVTVCGCFALLTGLAVLTGSYLRALDTARARLVQAARREQRMRLARDLHDWFAHEVTGIVLEAQAAALDTDGRTAETFARIERSGQRALGSVDHALALLRATEPGPAGLEEVTAMVRRFAESSPAIVELDVAPDAEPTGGLAVETVDTVSHLVLESLTNIRRHAGDVDRVEVRVERTARELLVSVTDDGDGRPRHRRGRGGTGLRTLAEGVTALGGTLKAGPAEPTGWKVLATLPVIAAVRP